MSTWTLILRSLRYYARSHAGAMLGAAVASAVLIGALVVGDSVRGSLRQMALSRIGQVDLALAANDRLFRAELANDFQKTTGAKTAPALMLPGTAAASDGSARANRVQVMGVDERFWQLAPHPENSPAISADGIFLNAPLAAQLKVKTGDTVLIRVPKPSSLSRDAPLSPEEDAVSALRLQVQGIVSEEHFGRFSLQANQVAPFNAFVLLKTLQDRTTVTNRANLLLVSDGKLTAESAQQALRQAWQLADAELELRALPDSAVVELRSSRVFLDSAIPEVVRKTAPNATGVLTYFVNELHSGNKSAPYSMVTAVEPPLVPSDLRDDEILVNEWLAKDLGAAPGDELKLTYFVVGAMRSLEEKSATFKIRSVLPMALPTADRTLMPDFPGLANAANCRDWDAGFPIKLDAIRDQDQKYWEEYRGTPKAFINLKTGQALWSNRFGNLTALRERLEPKAALDLGGERVRLEKDLRQALDPAAVGLSFQSVRESALAASAQSQDFGGLFIGFSLFLIVAALLLMALLFQFSIEQRATEMGTLLALGFQPKQVRRLLLYEGSALALVGSLIGLLGGVWYARAMLVGLTTIWRDAVGMSTLEFHTTPETLVLGCFAAFVTATLSMWLALRRQAKQSARELLSEGAGEGTGLVSTLQGVPGAEHPKGWTPNGRGWKSTLKRFVSAKVIGIASMLIAIALAATAIAKGNTADAETFFSAGMMLLIGGIALCSVFLRRLTHSEAAARLSLSGMGIRSATRRPRRSLATMSLLASGCFLIASIGVFHLDELRDAEKRSSGTGGFALIGEASLPILRDLNTVAGRDFYGIDAALMKDVQAVPLRVHDGDEASCLNLNRAQRPRLLGVQPTLLAQRQAFLFAEAASGLEKSSGWKLLQRRAGDDAIPAIGDEASILWAMGKKVGDTLDFTDERGRPFKIKIVAAVANSILQGNLLIAEDEFVARFPNEAGYRSFLFDAPPSRRDKVATGLSRALRDFGLELTPAARRLATFNAVQNTYLGTFQVLGGLGLLLGSFGLGVVVLRNVLERRGELALLEAVGFTRRSLQWLVVSEHGGLLLAGLGLGLLAAFVAVLPSVLSPAAAKPGWTLVLTLAAVLLNGALWTWLSTLLALRGKLVDALRSE